MKEDERLLETIKEIGGDLSRVRADNEKTEAMLNRMEKGVGYEAMKAVFENELIRQAKLEQVINWLVELRKLKKEKKPRWIPVSERLPKIKQHILLSCYGRVIYGRMISESGNSGYPIFEICDSVGEKRPIVLETTVHSKYTTSRITAWMPLPEPYVPDINVGKTAESEEV